jgi:hypothetical protein
MIEQRREEVRRLLEDAEKFCELAEREPELRQAAEKAWLCVRKATEAYFYATDPKADLRKLEEGIGLTAMFWERYKRDPEFSRLRVRNELGEWGWYKFAEDVLHGDCFYEGVCRPEFEEPIRKGAREYLQSIRKILKV